MQTGFTEEIIKFAATRSDSAVLSPAKGYYPFEIIAEAYEHGVEHGKNNMNQKMRDLYFENASEIAKSSAEIVNLLNKDSFVPEKLFVALSIRNSKILLSFEDDTFTSDEFMDKAYAHIAKIQSAYFEKDINVSISYLGENINHDMLKSDGFEFGIDLKTNSPLD